MFKGTRDKITLSGTAVLMIGVALLIFTFISSYIFLSQSLSIVTSSDLAQTFGEALAPLIAACIHVMYLGVMGWIGSLLTIRGVTIVSQTRQILPTLPTTTQKQTTLKEEKTPAVKTKVEEPRPTPKPKTEKPQEEAKQPEPKPREPEPKPYEPEIIVLPPQLALKEEEHPLQQTPQPTQEKQTENKQSSQQ